MCVCVYKFSSVWRLVFASQASRKGDSWAPQWRSDLGDQTSHGDWRDKSEKPQDSERPENSQAEQTHADFSNCHVQHELKDKNMWKVIRYIVKVPYNQI